MTTVTTKLQSTKIDIPEDKREKLVDLLNARLADLVDLGTQTKQAHWNIKGPSFIGLHELFDKIAADVREYSDLVAERVLQLGGLAAGTARDAASHSELPEYPHDITKGREHVDALSTALAISGKHVRTAIDKSEELGDAASADILTEIARGLDQYLWFVEAHMQENS